jgi:hypothetical protein
MQLKPLNLIRKTAALIFLLLLVPFVGMSQVKTENDSLITVRGRVIDPTKTVAFYNMVVVNKALGKGIFGDYNGEFEITLPKGDPVGISVVGYNSVTLSFADSAYKPVYEVTVHLKMLSFTGSEVVVTPLKSLEELQEERASIAKREVPVVTMENALTSPITALYIAFSKREQTKRLVAEMEYQDQQDDIVREILRVYVHNDIIDLDEEDFTEFITFLNLNTEFLQYASDYELITYIKEKYGHFVRIKEGF